MKSIKHSRSITNWNIILLSLVFFLIFVIGVFPELWQDALYNVFYTLIYFVAILAVNRDMKRFVYISLIMMGVNLSSSFLNMQFVENVSTIFNFLFFTIITAMLIKQVATAELVSPRVILEAINGYLLMGLVYSTAIAAIAKFDPNAINFPPSTNDIGGNLINFSDSLYYTFISITTMGYGDFVPTASYTRSLATLIGVSGQLYVAIIIALLVGKYSSQPKNKSKL